jgi:nitrite reductase (NADH) small subunit
MAWQSVFASEELPEGGMKLHPFGKREIGIFRHSGNLYAVLNFCPHAGAPICRGEIDHPIYTDTPGGTTIRQFGQPTIRCPWHRWEFDLQSGKGLCLTSPRIKTYPVREELGKIWIDL